MQSFSAQAQAGATIWYNETAEKVMSRDIMRSICWPYDQGQWNKYVEAQFFKFYLWIFINRHYPHIIFVLKIDMIINWQHTWARAHPNTPSFVNTKVKAQVS